MRIYTRTGDSGETGLFGGERVPKDALRVEAYGTVDESNATLGLAAASLAEEDPLRADLLQLQSALFVVGADLATPLPRPVTRITDADIEELEAFIDFWEASLTSLQTFILPGGAPAASALHLARTIVRRAERRTLSLIRAEPEATNPATLRYLNRLSDLLFVLARAANARAGLHDIPWKKEN